MDNIRQGQVFLHSRFIDTNRTPERCKITRTTSTTIYYRVGVATDGSGGSKYRLPREDFASAVREWCIVADDERIAHE